MTAGNKVRLKYGHVIECTGAARDASGQVTKVQAVLIADTKSGTPGSDAVKVKGVMTGCSSKPTPKRAASNFWGT
jgi:glutaminyl-tRNA synthetase